MLYHREIKWLDTFDKQSYKLIQGDLRLSNHLWEHLSTKDKKHDIEVTRLYLIVKELQKNPIEPFEVEIKDDKVVKCVVRAKYDDTKDISIVFREWGIVTCWVNSNSDLHYSLDRSKYVC